MLSYLISNIVSFRAQPYSVSHLPLIFFYERYKGNSGLTDVHISKTVSFTRRLNSSFLFPSLDDFDVVCGEQPNVAVLVFALPPVIRCGLDLCNPVTLCER